MRAAAPAERLLDLESALSFDDVFTAHAPYVARTLRCLGVREHELDDACQEVFVVVHRRLAEVEPRSLRAWLYGICLRKALAQRRLVARKKTDGPSLETLTVEPEQEATVARRQRLERALVILDGLPDAERAVFVLFEVEQLSMAEIAVMVGCPVQTAYSRLYAARRDIEAALRRLQARKDIP